MTVKEAAAILEVSAGLVYALVAAGKIRHARHGLGRGTIRISADALEEYRRSSAAGGVTAPPSAPASARASSGPPAAPFSELDPRRLRRAWKKG